MSGLAAVGTLSPFLGLDTVEGNDLEGQRRGSTQDISSVEVLMTAWTWRIAHRILEYIHGTKCEGDPGVGCSRGK